MPHTIGYQGAPQAALIAALQSAGVQLLADVRAVPRSRRPGFSKSALAAACTQAGIAYRHFGALGTPPEGREAARRHDLASLERIYTAQLATPEAQAQAAELTAEAAARPTALLCFEADPAHCHRTLLHAALFDTPPIHLHP